ncbi:MAG: WbqC family protein [Bacteroidales bacterium]|nr:WbqC family protein [Bacteroidales bacterium]
MLLPSSDSAVLLSTAYFPPIDYFVAIANGGDVRLEQYENYCKQSYRSRCNIFACDGVLSLTIPVVTSGNNTPIREVKVDYTKKWLQQHTRALVSAYMSSPFFEYYQDDIFGVLESGEKYLFDLNCKLMDLLMENLGLNREITLTDEYIPTHLLQDNVLDYRERIHPKKGSPIFTDEVKQKPYYQVFSQKYGFVSGLSVLDLLFNEGPQASTFLRIGNRK